MLIVHFKLIAEYFFGLCPGVSKSYFLCFGLAYISAVAGGTLCRYVGYALAAGFPYQVQFVYAEPRQLVKGMSGIVFGYLLYQLSFAFGYAVLLRKAFCVRIVTYSLTQHRALEAACIQHILYLCAQPALHFRALYGIVAIYAYKYGVGQFGYISFPKH